MDILTLVKADIRHKKGSFAVIMALMILISMSLTAILSLKKSCMDSIENAYEQSGAGDFNAFIRENRLTDKLLHSVENHSLVDRVDICQAVVSDKAEAENGNADTNTWMAMELRDGIKLYNSSRTAYEDEIPPLKEGEIYIPQGVATNMKCGVGDVLRITGIGGEYKFTIQGIVVEPVCGASVIGWKQVFISDSDLGRMLSDAKKAETEEKTGRLYLVSVFRSDSCALTQGEFARRLNLDTGISDNAFGSLTKEVSIRYTGLFSEITASIMMVFIGILLVVVLIIMGHSISTEMEINYINLGVLKAYGFSNGKIRTVFLWQYLLAESLGAVMGSLFAIPLLQYLGNVFQPITGILAEQSIAWGTALSVLLAVLAASGAFILVITRRIGKISPVRAILGGQSEIYFDSRIKAPVCRKGLSASLALRQLTSGKRRYAAAIAIVSILVFFMMTVSVLSNVMSSRTALEAMGEKYSEVEVRFITVPDDALLEKLEKTVETYSPIRKKYYCSNKYFSLEGEEVRCIVYKNPDCINPSKGRAPLYDNEIVITDIVADAFDIGMGDSVTVSHHNEKAEYIVSGIFPCMEDAGRSIAMSLDGAKRLKADEIVGAGYSLEEEEKKEEIVSAINKEFGGEVEAEVVENADETLELAVQAMRAVIYIFSVVFALVVVTMVCSKTFTQEKTDIGIYKAMGFTSGKLRLQFAVRFLGISSVGSALGAGLSVLFSGRMLSVLLRNMGITNFVADFTAVTFLGPTTLICICFFVFAYLVSRRVKRVAIRELVVE